MNTIAIAQALTVNTRHKKTRYKPGFCNTRNVINVLRIEDAYALYEDQLSYVQLYVHRG